MAIAGILCVLGDQKSALPDLLSLLDHKNPNVRSDIARTLGRLGNTSESITQALLSLLTDENSAVRSEAAFALGELDIKSETVIQDLLQLLRGESFDDKSYFEGDYYDATWTLGKLCKDAELLSNTMLGTLKKRDSDERLRYIAVYTLTHNLAQISDKADKVVQRLFRAVVLVNRVEIQPIGNFEGCSRISVGIDNGCL